MLNLGMIDSDTLKRYAHHLVAGEERLQVVKTKVEANHVPMFKLALRSTDVRT
jgi:hypothetical protein